MSDNNTSADLNEPVDRRIDRKLADIDIPEPLSEARVRELIADHAPSGDGPTGDFDQLRRDVTIAVNPDHTAIVETGPPTGEMHAFAGWGLIISVLEPVHWRSAEIDAGESGTVRLAVHDIAFEREERYDLGEIRTTRQIPVEAGRQTIPTEITLPPGQYFITREDTTPMRRAMTDVDWSELNASHDLPMRFEASWQVGRTPEREEDFQQYLDRGWSNILHYFGQMEFGYMDSDTEG